MDTENTAPENNKTQWSQYIVSFLVIFFIAYAWFLALGPLGDADIWFHLKNGQYILDTHSLPGPEDPYGFTLEGVELEGTRLQGLRSQWLGQVILYSVFDLFGARGLSVLRATLLVLPFFLLLMLGVARGESAKGLAARLAIISFPALFLAVFFPVSFERPQGFSFLFAFIILVILDSIEKEGSSRLWVWSLPITMVVWSNIHGGYVVGVFMIALWAFGNLIALITEKKGLPLANYLSPALVRPKKFFTACVLGVLAAGLHPGGFLQVKFALIVVSRYFSFAGETASGGTSVLGQVLEYKPLAFFLSDLHLVWPLHVFAFFGASLAAMVIAFYLNGRVRLPLVFVSVFVVWFGTVYFRGIFFTLPALAFCVIASVQGLKGWKRAAPAILTALVLVFMLAHYGAKEPWRFQPERTTDWVSGDFPEKAIQFMRANDVKGPLFNYLGWGGYLIWSAWPDYRVFVDGRELDPVAFGEYVKILRGTADWKEVLDSYGINAILVPALSKATGAIFPILFKMGWDNDRGWSPVYMDNNTVLLVRRGSEGNQGVIECCDITHNRMNRYVADYASLMLLDRPGDITLYESMAAALYFSRQEERALNVLMQLPETNLKRALIKRINK